MLVIPKSQSSTFVRSGAIVPTKEELDAMIHALIEGRDKATSAGTAHYSTEGKYFGKLTIKELDALIVSLQQYQRGA